MSRTDALCIGIDPGSSKDWATCWIDDEVPASPLPKPYKIADLDDLIEEVVKAARKRLVVVAIDSPIRIPGCSMPGRLVAEDFSPAALAKSDWPFDANLFSTRPCERALHSSVENREGAIADALRATLSGSTTRDSALGNFTKFHQGASVMGYQAAPNGPVVRVFVNRLFEYAKGKGVRVSFEPHLADGSEPQNASRTGVVVLEAHPAVAMAFWAWKTSQEGLPRYKNRKAEGQDETLKEARHRIHKQWIPEPFRLKSLLRDDGKVISADCLDALVAAVNAYELANGEGDWFGDVKTGYFLIPKVLEGGKRFSNLWSEAAKAPSGC